jgi:hypothetical protein
LNEKILKSFLVTSLILMGASGCSSSEQTDSSSNATSSSETETNDEGLKCKENIEIQEGKTINLKNYCTYNGISNDAIVVSPSTVSTKKVGEQTVDITATDPEGIIYYYTVKVKVTAKPAPTPEATPTPTPTPEATPEPTQETTVQETPKKNYNYSNNNSSSSSSNTQTQQETPAQQQTVEQPSTSTEEEPSGSTSSSYKKKSSSSSGAAAGSVYGDVNSCDAAASTTVSHTCTYDPTKGWVLTY